MPALRTIIGRPARRFTCVRLRLSRHIPDGRPTGQHSRAVLPLGFHVDAGGSRDDDQHVWLFFRHAVGFQQPDQVIRRTPRSSASMRPIFKRSRTRMLAETSIPLQATSAGPKEPVLFPHERESPSRCRVEWRCECGHGYLCGHNRISRHNGTFEEYLVHCVRCGRASGILDPARCRCARSGRLAQRRQAKPRESTISAYLGFSS